MSITIPTTYSLEDLTVGEGIASGQLITASGLSTIADNHNFIGGNYRPPVAEVFDVDGFGTFTTSGYYNLTGTPVLEELDGRGMTFIGVFTNSSGSNPSTLRLACGSNTGSTVSLPVGATAQTVTLTCDTPSSGNFVASVQVSGTTADNTTLLLTGSFFWSGKTGSQSASPTSGGFVWAQSSQLQDTFPLTVEQVNRFIGGPLTAWNAAPQTMGSLNWDWTFRAPTTSSTSYTEIGRIILKKRRPTMKIKIGILGVNATVKASYYGGDVETATAATGGPTHNLSPSTVTVNLSSSIDLVSGPDLFPVVLYMKSTSGSAAKVTNINFILDKS
jgi:hypothetical protein